ncbi:MAG: Fic family protein [Bacteroidota bacterium]
MRIFEPNNSTNRLMKYNWQLKEWPNFKYSLVDFSQKIQQYAEKMGHIKGVLSVVSKETQVEAMIDRMVLEAIKTSEIEGEFLSRKDVMSSIKNNLGLNLTREIVRDKRARGIGEMMVQIREIFAEDLTAETLHQWHRALMTGNQRVQSGVWRSHESPMQVVSGTIRREEVHYEAPPSNKVPQEMEQFVDWFNSTRPGGIAEISAAPIRSAIAHLYFESIHPYEDGNGRIGRAISEKILYQHANYPLLISLSEAIEKNRNAYYQALMQAQQTNDLTDWIGYFMDVVLYAQDRTIAIIDFTLKKTNFFNQFNPQLNQRQTKVLRRMLRDGASDFKDGINAKKYMAIAKTSKATATRDLQQLVQLAAVQAKGSGRSTRYFVNL